MIIRNLIVAVAVAANIEPTIAQNAIEKPELKVDDRWLFRTVDVWKSEKTQTYEYKVTGLAGENVELVRTVVATKTGEGVGQSSVRKAERSTLSLVDSGIFEGRFIAFAFPLEIGKTWEYEFKTKNRDGDTTTNSRTAKVEAWENVTVPAGTFRALKVVHTGRWARSRFSGSVTETLWYSP